MLKTLRPATLSKETPTQVFFREICKIFKSTKIEEYRQTVASPFSTYTKFFQNFFALYVQVCASYLETSSIIKFWMKIFKNAILIKHTICITSFRQ